MKKKNQILGQRVVCNIKKKYQSVARGGACSTKRERVARSEEDDGGAGEGCGERERDGRHEQQPSSC